MFTWRRKESYIICGQRLLSPEGWRRKGEKGCTEYLEQDPPAQNDSESLKINNMKYQVFAIKYWFLSLHFSVYEGEQIAKLVEAQRAI